MSAPTLLAGPAALGIELSADARVEDGWLVRELVAPPGLDGPPGVLQGGFSAGITMAVARLADRFGAPVTSIEARLHAPTPLGQPLQARVRPSEQAARYQVETRDGDRLLVSAEVELAGHEPAARAFDLLELARVPLPEARPQHVFPHCWVCGPEPRHPHGQRIHPRVHREGEVSQPWVADDELGDDRSVVDPLVVAAVLDCPTVWACMHEVQALEMAGPLLAGYHLRFYRDAPVMEPLRTVARFDEADGRKLRGRSALVDEDGVTYAVAAALQVAVPHPQADARQP
jgi:hypothetical protein